MPLQSKESRLLGKWKLVDGDVVPDATCQRIEELISTALIEVASSTDGWGILYIDPLDGRYWELSYPDSSLHGGGPPALTCLSVNEARRRYHVTGSGL
jgi:hypothetical protein